MTWPLWAFLAIGLYAAGVAAAHWIARAGPEGDPETGLVIRVFQMYARLAHNLRIEGLEHIPRSRAAGPMIVVANHTAGVDPILIQAACPFMIRWLMAEDMRVDWLNPMWELGQVIFVDRRKGESMGVRDALRHLRRGGVIGVFPEGHLERPPRQILPFLPGVGMLIHRSGAPVLMLTIDGAPQVDPAWASLWRPSRTTVRAHTTIDYKALGLSARDITEDLRRRYCEATGWPRNEITPRLVGMDWVQVDVHGRWPDGRNARSA